MLTASGDEKQFDKGKGWIKIAVIALIGIGMSRLIVSLILWLITKLTS
jgi:glucose-6-phosphate isomerase